MHATVYCLTCEEDVAGTSQYLSTKDDGKKDYTVNQQAVFAALVCGMGAQQLNKFCESMDPPGVHHKTFQKKVEKLYAKMNELEDAVFFETVKYVREVHAKHSGITLSDDDVLDISVSFDGSWITRGHTSHIGIGCVVVLLTGLCIDAHVMCNFCLKCATTGKKIFEEKPLEYAAWLVKHLPACEKNFTGSSGMMEVEAARVLWRRSVTRHKLRYTVLLSDGDTKSFQELTMIKPYGDAVLIEKEECINHQELTMIKPYGDAVLIEKEECINHVSKRLGTALSKVVADCGKRGVTLGGRGRGSYAECSAKDVVGGFRSGWDITKLAFSGPSSYLPRIPSQQCAADPSSSADAPSPTGAPSSMGGPSSTGGPSSMGGPSPTGAPSSMGGPSSTGGPNQDVQEDPHAFCLSMVEEKTAEISMARHRIEKDLPEAEVNRLHQQIETADAATLAGDEAVQDMLSDCKVRVAISERNRTSVVTAVLASQSRLKTKHAMLEAFWTGAEVVGLQTLIRQHGGKEACTMWVWDGSQAVNATYTFSLLKPACAQQPQLTAEIITGMFTTHSIGEVGSN
ncbi:hypothetical protein BaRGS_00029905, partial [Batillaria attramentaria]